MRTFEVKVEGATFDDEEDARPLRQRSETLRRDVGQLATAVALLERDVKHHEGSIAANATAITEVKPKSQGALVILGFVWTLAVPAVTLAFAAGHYPDANDYDRIVVTMTANNEALRSKVIELDKELTALTKDVAALQKAVTALEQTISNMKAPRRSR